MHTTSSRLSFLGAALLLGSAALAQTAPAPASAPAASSAPTWHRDVLPIVRERCQVCHEPEGVGAFPMLTHAQTVEHLADIGEAVRSGYMPPWQPADGCQSFRDARRLTRREADILLAWVAAGGPAGAPSEAPPAPSKLSGLAQVDLTLTAPPVGPAAAESIRCHAFAPDAEKARDLVAYEVHPGGPGVQHVLLFSAPDLDVKALDAQDAEPGWACSGDPGGLNAQVLGVWAPGSDVTRLPPGTGVRLPAGAPLVLQVHTSGAPSGKAPGPTVAKLQFSRSPVARTAWFMPVWKSNYSLPAKSTGFTLNRTLQVPEDGILLGVFPHMHGLGRRIKLEAGNACVIDIPYWDTSAQQAYFFESLVGVPLRTGSRMTLTCTWNNPGPQRVRSGEGAGKEMCLAWLYLTR
jgi:mono/diheme cytochrome c family protein